MARIIRDYQLSRSRLEITANDRLAQSFHSLTFSAIDRRAVSARTTLFLDGLDTHSVDTCMQVGKDKTLLLVGGSHADIPMIKAAKKLGFTVFTSGNRAADLGHRHGDGYYPTDYSDRAQVLDLARRLHVDALCPSCNDFSALSCAYVAEKLGLPGHDTLEASAILHHKDRYRQFASTHGIHTPKALSFDSPPLSLTGLDFPVVVKPVDLTGGKGISRVDEVAHFAEAISGAFAISREKRVVVEEFVVGTRHAISTFIVDRRVRFSLTDTELYYLNPYLVSGAYAPGPVSGDAEHSLRLEIEKMADRLDLVDGIVHVQFILTEHGPTIIEVCRRPPGDLYVDLVSHVTGVDYAKWLVMGYAGLAPEVVPAPEKKASILRHCVMADRPGRVEGLFVSPSIKDSIVDQMLWHDGAQITNHLTDKVGIMFLRFENPEELAAVSNKIHELIFPIMGA